MSTKKRTVTKPTHNIESTNYWLNIRTPLGVIGIRLANGISQHEKFIDLIEKHGIVKVNKWLETKEFDGYVVDASESTTTDELDEEFANL